MSGTDLMTIPPAAAENRDDELMTNRPFGTKEALSG